MIDKFRTGLHSIFSGQLIRNAASLYGTTIVTNALGFFYWFIAARLVSAEAVGIASAIQSAAQLLSVVCVVGLSTLLISELSHDKSQARNLMLSASVFSFGIACIATVIVSLVIRVFKTNLTLGVESVLAISIFVVLAALTTVLAILDDACIGLLRGDLQLTRNAVFAISKLALLPVLIILWKARYGEEMVAAWAIGLVISLIVLTFRLSSATKGQVWRVDIKGLLAKRHLMVSHHWLNISNLAPRLVLPIVVTTVVGAEENAGFTAALLIIGFINIIPSLLSTVLFALARGDEAALRREVKNNMRISLFLAIVTPPTFILLSHFALGLFGEKYVAASSALAILSFTTYPAAIKSHYVAIYRVRGLMNRAALSTTLGAALEVGFAVIGGVIHGVSGVALGYLIACCIEAFIFGPTVWSVVHNTGGRGKHARSRQSRRSARTQSADVLPEV